MPKMTLTDISIRRKPPTRGTLELWDAVMPGLALRIHSGGRRSYCVTTRLAGTGKQIRRTIGTVDTHSLAEAREAARAVIRDAGQGIDSASRQALKEAARQKQREAERAKAGSVRATVDAYLADPGKGGGATLKSRKLVEQRFENHVLPLWGDRTLASITRADVRDLVRNIAIKHPIAANRVLSNVRRLFNWALAQDCIDHSPVAGVEAPSVEVSRDRVLTNSELAAIWRGCDKLSAVQGTAIKVMMLTGARRTEVGGLRRSELSDDGLAWNLPATRSKNRRPHIVPLSELAGAVIESVPQVTDDGADGDLVFSLDGKRAVKGWSKIKTRLDHAIGEARAGAMGDKKSNAGKYAITAWTFHDLRRTLVTGMIEDLDIAPHVVEAVVNHVSGQSRAGVAGIYNRAVLLPQRREALEAWSRHIQAIVSNVEPVSNVATLKRRA